MYIQKKNQYLSVSGCDGEQEQDKDPYAFVEGDEEFSFTDKEKRPGAEPAKRNKVNKSSNTLVASFHSIMQITSLSFHTQPSHGRVSTLG